MSHFTVLLKITQEALATHENVGAAVAKMLAPYQENNMGDCPREYMEFHDLEDEYREEYETGSTEMIRCEDGSLAHSFDERFRVPGTIGIGGGSHRVPEHLERVDVPHKERYATFDQFAEEWHGSRGRDPEKGRYGYWENPNKKWDWYQIGGRWSGFFPVKADVAPELGERSWAASEQKPGHADIVRVKDLDVDTIASESVREAEAFWGRWEMFKRGEVPLDERGKPDVWFTDSVRDQALRIGLLQVVRTTEGQTVPEGWSSSSREWERADDKRRTWRDALSPITREEFMARYVACFNPIKTYAALDHEGWHAPGEMGWFGCSSDTPDGYIEFANQFWDRFIRNANSDDTLVVVDCHI